MELAAFFIDHWGIYRVQAKFKLLHVARSGDRGWLPTFIDERGVWPWEKGREQFSCRVIGTSDEIICIQT